jgi:hypothetical protein
MTEIQEILDQARRFAASRLTGFSDVILVSDQKGIAFQREIEGKGNGVSVAPQISAIPGGAFLGSLFSFSHSKTKTGMYSRAGAAVLVFARAPMHSQSAIMSLKPEVKPTKRKVQPEKDSSTTQRVIVQIQTPNSK